MQRKHFVQPCQSGHDGAGKCDRGVGHAWRDAAGLLGCDFFEVIDPATRLVKVDERNVARSSGQWTPGGAGEIGRRARLAGFGIAAPAEDKNDCTFEAVSAFIGRVN
jgi:hypothetical protein